MSKGRQPGVLSLLRARAGLRKQSGHHKQHDHSVPTRHKHGHHEHEAHCASLCCAKRGQSVNVLQLVGNATEAAKLRDLGVREGALVTIVRDGDPLMVKIAGTRFGIGRAAAMNVLCELREDLPSCRRH